MKSITEAGDLKGKRVILRSSLNVPLADGVVQNKYRLTRAMQTMRYLHEQGAKTIILAHMGRDPEETLKPVFNELEKNFPVHWGGRIDSQEFSDRVALMKNGDFLMAENTRQHEGEKTNDEGFSELIASLGELFVHDAFAAAHREHASTYGVAKLLPAYAGLNLMQEVQEVSKVMQPEHPALFLLGGAKFDTKMPLIEKYLDLYDHVFVAGALANDIFKARGLEVGKSLVSDVSLASAPFLHSEKLLIPIDVVVDGPEGIQTKQPEKVTPEEIIFDCGPKTVEMLKPYITAAKTILWNGPFGNYEGGYKESTEATAKLLEESEAFSVVGGGDTVAAIEKLGLNDHLGFVSTGGGAMLTLLEHGSLSTIDILNG